MISWIVENGGEVNVVVKNTAEAGRSTWAPRDFAVGDVLAKIPLSICFKAEDADLLVKHAAAAHLWSDINNSSSPLQPYYQALPNRSEVWAMHSIPEPYLPLVQNPPTERAIVANHDKLTNSWQLHKEQLQAALGPETSIEDMRYTMSLLVTRLFELGEDGLRLVPLLDMANHWNDCNHTHPVEKCRPGSSERCVVWRAAEPLAAGDEVCNFYKFMLQDRSVLQYGFLQSGPVEHQLSGLDRPDFKPEDPWEEKEAGENGPLLFEGTPSAIVVELYRLQQLQSTLVKLDTELTPSIKPHPRDVSGYYLQTMLTWRRQRQEAIAAEIQRLQRQLQRLQAAEERVQQLQSLGLGLPQSAYDSFTAALQKQGAQLNVTVKSTADRGYCKADATASNTCSSRIQPAALLAGFPPSAVFATRDVKAGNALAVMPLKNTIRVASGAEGLAETAVRLMLEMHQQASQAAAGTEKADASSGNSTAAFWRAFYAALPPLGTVAGVFGIPPDYLPLIQEPAVEAGIKAYQVELLNAWDKHRPAIEAVDPSLTLQELRHVTGLLNARLVSYEYGSFVVPLMGLASHQVNNNCPHADYLDYCPGSAAAQQAAAGQEPQQEAGAEEDDLCIVWAAGADVAAGQEVCSSYGYLMPDVALLQYGVLLQDNTTATAAAAAGKAERLELNAMDRHDFDPKQPFAPLKSGHEAPEPFSGTPQQALAEVARLVVRHTNLTSIEAHHAAAAVNPSAYDRGGMLLAQMRVWRQRRIAALEAEIERLIKSYGLDQEAVQQQVSVLLLVQQQQQQEEWQAQAAAKKAAAESKAAGSSSAAAAGSQGAAVNGAAAGGDEESDPWQDVVHWVKEHGAVVNVDVRYVSPEAGRAVFTQRAMKKGELLVALPLDLAFSAAKHGGNGPNELAAANLLGMMADQSSPMQTYFASLPTKEELLSPLVSMPEEYLPLLQSDLAVESVNIFQQRVNQFWEAYQPDFQAQVPGVTLEDFKWARALLATRFFGGDAEHGSILLPLLDMANHMRHCPNYQVVSPCPTDESRRCVHWLAGSYLLPGQEVCTFYQFMLNDRTMLQYGFLQSEMPELHTLDRADSGNVSTAWTQYHGNKFGPPPFNGSLSETQAELARLRALAAELVSGDAAAAAAKPVADDAGGRLLSLVLRWRQMRQEAVKREVLLLEAREQQLKAGKLPGVVERFMSWLAENGAQVHEAVQIRQDAGSHSLVATGAIAAGQHLAVIPLKTAVAVYTGDLLDEAPRLWRDMIHPASPRRPYWDMLPANGSVFSYYNLPLQYLGLIQHASTEESIADMRGDIEAFLQDNPEILTKAEMTIVDVLHVLSLIATRVYEFQREGTFMIPFVDLAKHCNGCTNRLAVHRCGPIDASPSPASDAAVTSSDELCIYWKTGSAIAAGEDVCMGHGYLLPDRALLQYGFVLSQQQATGKADNGAGQQQQPLELSAVDRHDLPTAVMPWQYRLEAKGPPPAFAGTSKQSAAEVERLTKLAAALAAGDAAAAAAKPAPGDESGLLLSMIKQWRQQRQQAVAAAIKGLQASASASAVV
uniref:SET domain-containing protein n=1 Tax=Tetradesmus obliquus TaxID=3088 RepID=A0A383VSU2_TETOB